MNTSSSPLRQTLIQASSLTDFPAPITGKPSRRRSSPALCLFAIFTFPLLSDPDKKVLTAWGAFGEKSMYGKTVQGVIRSTFVVDEKGKIEVAQYNVKATGHVDKLRRDLGI